MKLALLVLLPALAVAQSYSSHSGWSFDDTLHSATDILVGRIASGSGADTGSEVRVNVALRVIRVLQGAASPGSDLRVDWQYQPAPNQGPAVTMASPEATGIFFLRKRPSGSYEALRATGPSVVLGGFVLPVPASAPGAALMYAPDLPLQGKLAREIAAGMQGLAAASLAWQSLSMALEGIDKPQALPVFQYLSTLADVHLRTAGLLGRLSAGDASAIFEIERDLPRIAASAKAGHFGPGITGFDASRDLAAAHALARIGLSETPLPGVEGGMIFSLASTRSPEFLPYLMTMLGSPDSGTRGGALMGICMLLGPASVKDHCPDHSPLNDAELERRHIQFWTGWWGEHREAIAKTVNLPTVIAPSRYNAAPVEEIEVPMEIRLQSLLGLSANRNQAAHYHSGGDVIDGPPPGPPDPVSGQLAEADRAFYRRLIDATNTKLEEHQQRAMAMINATRLAGTMPERTRLEALEAERQALLASALRELRAGLSPEGWQAVERFLMNMGIRSIRAKPPGAG